VEGRHTINAGRYKRNEPTAAVIGDPPSWMAEIQGEAWRDFAAELPWLNRSHRCLLEVACILRARLQSGGDVGTKALSLLRLCLSSLGATPSDASKVSWSPRDQDDFDDIFG
jgi:hypothetical protein